jgi:hypothetical protein
VRLDDTDRQRVYHQWGSPGLAFAIYLETVGESTLLGNGAAGEEISVSVAGQCGVADVFPVLVRVTAPATDYPSDYRYTLTLEFVQP